MVKSQEQRVAILTPHALTAYEFLTKVWPKDSRINSEILMPILKRGRDYCRKVMAELVEKGLVERARRCVRGTWSSSLTLLYNMKVHITDDGALTGRPVRGQSSSKPRRPHTIITRSKRGTDKINHTTCEKTSNPTSILRGEIKAKESHVSWGLEDESKSETKPTDTTRSDPFAKVKEKFTRKKKAKGFKHRDLIPTSEWKVPHFCAEFAAECQMKFPMRPLPTPYTTRFLPAMASMRDSCGSTGPVEVKAMQVFFSNAVNYADCEDFDHIWKRFIKMCPTLIPLAHRLLNPDLETPVLSTEELAESRSHDMTDPYYHEDTYVHPRQAMIDEIIAKAEAARAAAKVGV